MFTFIKRKNKEYNLFDAINFLKHSLIDQLVKLFFLID